jgi:hypothetical protein
MSTGFECLRSMSFPAGLEAKYLTSFADEATVTNSASSLAKPVALFATCG